MDYRPRCTGSIHRTARRSVLQPCQHIMPLLSGKWLADAHMRAAIEITQHPQRARGNSRCKPLPVDLSPLVLRVAGGCRLCLPDGWRWCRSLRGRLDFGFGELAAQVC